MNRLPPLILSVSLVSALGLAGCVGAPEHCRGCLAALADAGPSAFEVRPASGGRDGGVVATGGGPGSGGAGSGGNTGSGGAASGGAMGTGGAAGGAATGGSGTGGANTGGAATGGRGTGGANTGGAATGGRGTGGANTGGAATGGMGTGGAAGAPVDPDLVLWFKFDEASGTTIADSAMFGGTARNGTLTNVGAGTATFSTTTHQVGTRSLNLTSSSSTVGAYATALPSPGIQVLAPGAVTIACWVYIKSDQIWQRVFDFGNTAATPLVYMFLTTNQNASTPNYPRFAISTMGTGMEQVINRTTQATLSTGAWHHFVIVLPAGATYTGTMYIDGTVAGTNTNMTLHPAGLGATANNFLGKSQFPDIYLNSYLDDFRIYRRALTSAEVTALYAVR